MPRAEIDFVLTGANVNAQGDFTCPPVFADFTDATDGYGNITGWSWSFGDGKFSTLQDPSNTYVFAGTYTANLTITDEFGCTNDTTLVDYLTIFGPSGDPDWLDLGDVCGKTYQFEAQNLISVAEIIWNLGDGQTINDINPFDHTYDDYDVYNPTATLIDSLGCEVVMELDPIVLISNGLNALFDLAPQEGPIGTVFTIDDQSSFTSSPIVTWVWDLNGDTTINSGGSIIQPFGLPGTYPITLTITDVNGCTNTYSSFAIVNGDFSLPNVITVNNDGTNDLFILPADIFESFDIFILNRWGNAVHEEYNAVGVLLWDGMAQSGNPVSDGVYFYKLIGTLVNGEIAEKDGFVTVIRD
jgi:PKD repeat protein